MFSKIEKERSEGKLTQMPSHLRRWQREHCQNAVRSNFEIRSWSNHHHHPRYPC